ncbi:YfgM family protein [Leeia oryzae]|uniref:YfgM family protein n=1 Tax=Leeia oryzae TaxID=356662 RepID=UPI00037D2F58|nr:tetratricopeptide repeat protein [Leeia oryzae]
MAVYDLQEQEQLDALKAWWQDNGKFVIGLSLSALVVFGGVQGWKYWKNKQSAEAAQQYEVLQTAISAKKDSVVTATKQKLVSDYAGTAYASRGAILAAHYEWEKGQTADVVKDLEWVVSNATEAPLKDLAHLRLATVLLDGKQYDKALSELALITVDPLKGQVSNLKGDILWAKGDASGAKSMYQVAIEQLEKGDPLQSVVEMKLDALGGGK